MLDSFSEDEIRVVSDNIVVLNNLKDKYSGSSTPDEILLDILTLSYDQTIAETAYKNIYNVVEAHWSEYPLYDQWKLEQFNESSNVLNDELKELIMNINTQDAAKKIYQVSNTALTILTLL